MKMNVFKIVLLLSLLFPMALWAKPIHVAFINPGFKEVNETGPFWSQVSKFMQAAANDLDIKLTTFYANRDHIYMKHLALQALKEQPDYLILVNEKQMGQAMLKQLPSNSPPVLFLLNGLEKNLLEQHPKVLGNLLPDNLLAGKKLTDSLLSKATSKVIDQSIKVLALQGDLATPAALERFGGLKLSLKMSSTNTQLVDARNANWSYQQGYELTKGLLQRNPDIHVLWSANDAIAFGAQKAAKELGLTPIIGGFNWDSVPSESKPLSASFGGHVTLGALALIKLKQFHQDQTTALNLNVDIFTGQDSPEVKTLRKIMRDDRHNDIEFNKPALQYHFTIDRLLINQ